MPFARYFCIFINVGLGEGSALPVGVPVPWPSATPPTGWLKCNGAAFSAEEYPELAKAYPTNKLPDLRISGANGEYSHQLLAPADNISIAKNELAVLGTISWT
ncbi:tail fiber protein [Escherichia coli]|nr:tail fiber protein [Escherichia coli]